MESSVQHSSVKLLTWCYEASVPVLSDLCHAYHTHGEASLPASSMNCGVKRRPMRVKPSDGSHVAATNAQKAFLGSWRPILARP